MEEVQVIDALGALAEPTRLRIVRHLVGCGDDGASAGSIGDMVDAYSSRASFHLAALERAGIVSSERQSRSKIYRAKLDKLGGVISYLLNDCCANDPVVCACCLPDQDCCAPS